MDKKSWAWNSIYFFDTRKIIVVAKYSEVFFYSIYFYLFFSLPKWISGWISVKLVEIFLLLNFIQFKLIAIELETLKKYRLKAWIDSDLFGCAWYRCYEVSFILDMWLMHFDTAFHSIGSTLWTIVESSGKSLLVQWFGFQLQYSSDTRTK